MGIVYAPVLDRYYFAEKDKGAWRQDADNTPRLINARKADPENLCVVASKDHAGPEVATMLERMEGASLKSMGSSLKFCLVAEGEADFYPRFVPTMEWDTAAAQCVVEAAGGKVCLEDGLPLRYQKKTLTNPSVFTIGDTKLCWMDYLNSSTIEVKT